MTQISYFQRFSQPENHATNNALLLLRHLYQLSPFKIGRLLTDLVETDLSIGLSFQQQVRGQASTPDALISQTPLNIYVETKRGGALDKDQIERHIKTIGRRENCVLMGLTKEQISEAERKTLSEAAAAQGIRFAAITFSQLAEAARRQCAPHETELLAIVDDYETFLNDEQLAEERDRWLVVFPCGISIAENAQFGLYYEPPARPCKRYRFIGVYKHKVVSYVGTVEAIVVGSSKDGHLDFGPESGTFTDAHRERIRLCIGATKYYDVMADPQRFYLVDRFVSTELRKTSPGGIMGLRYLDLCRVLASFNPRKAYTTEEIASALRGQTWE